MTLFRKVTTTAAALLTAALVLPATPANAVGCYSTSCSGKDPQTMGCASDAVTRTEISASGARFQMRYSPACNAAWTRTLSTEHFNTLFGQIISYTCSAATASCRHGIYGAQVLEGTNWTAMWSFTYWVRTCYSTSWYNSEPNGCSAAH